LLKKSKNRERGLIYEFKASKTHVPQVPKNFSTILKSLQDKGLANYCLIHELVLKRKKGLLLH
jgi:hypothetical protein